MSAELFFIYDSHCPWSYATTQLVNEIAKALPKIKIHFLHGAYFDGDDIINGKQILAVKQASNVDFSDLYMSKREQTKDSTLAANVLAWADQKSPKQTLALLNAIQYAHFQQGKELKNVADIEEIINELKLSPPSKTLTLEKLSKDAERNINEIFEIQEIIGTKAIPALLLTNNDNVILMNHNFYLKEPTAIVDAIKLELKK